MTSTYPLADELFTHFPAAVRLARASEAREISDALSVLWGRAERAEVSVRVDRASFIEAVARSLPDDFGVEALHGLHAEDLALAVACAAGDASAIQRFEARLFPEMERALRRLDDPPRIDELKQLLRTKLFVPGADGVGRISTYSGRGPLAAWVCAAAVRASLSLRREARRDATRDGNGGDEPLMDLPTDDPELSILKARYRPDFKDAFQAAVSELTVKERGVLKMYVLDGMSIDAIGLLHQVHRATIARWIAKAREQLLRATRQRLATRLRLDGPELDSLLRLADSDLDVSLERLLDDHPLQ